VTITDKAIIDALPKRWLSLIRPQARYQAVLDRHWELQRDLEFDDDAYEVGGFVEYHSKTPSFHKSRRDRDWRVR